MEKKEYPKGIWWNPKRDNSPDFVLGSISISKESFSEWLKGKDADEKGYIKLDVLNGKEGKPYVAVNNFKPNKQEELPTVETDNIPF